MTDTSLVFNLLARDKTGPGMSSAKKKFVALGIGIGGAAVAMGASSVKAFANFDSAMGKSLAIMGDVSEDMRGKMSSAAREVGKTTTFSASEAAESYFFLASAGMDATQAVAAMPQVAKFAQAGMFDMSTATDLATDAQSALGLVSDDAATNLQNLTKVTDVFVKANTLANTSVEQIAAAMTNKAGAAMRSVGMDIEEGSAVLAAFADQGLKGQVAGTTFSIVLRDLQTQALKHKDAFKEAGIAVYNSKGEFRNMADVVGDLEGSLKGMTDAEKKAALAALGFSDKSMGALQTLLGTSDSIREYEGELRKAGGTTDDIAAKQMETFQAKIQLLKSRFQDIQITIGQKLVPALLNLADGVSSVMGWLKKHETTAKVLGITIGALAAAIVTTVIAMKIHATWLKVTAVLQAGSTFRTALATTGYYLQAAAIRVCSTAVRIWAAGQWLLNAAMSGNPAVLITLAIIALIAVIVVIATKTTWFQTIWEKAWGAIKAAVLGTFDWIKTNWPLILAIITGPIGLAVLAIVKHWDKIKRVFTRGWEAVKSGVTTTVNFVKDKFTAIVDFIKKLPSRIGRAARGMFDGIKEAFREAINFIIRGWNNLSWHLPGIGFGPFKTPSLTLNTPDIPELAAGGTVTSAGLALVGERGPELLSLNKGAQVTPLGRGAAQRTVIEFDFTGADADMIRMFRKAIRVRGGNVQIVLGGNR